MRVSYAIHDLLDLAAVLALNGQSWSLHSNYRQDSNGT